MTSLFFSRNSHYILKPHAAAQIILWIIKSETSTCNITAFLCWLEIVLVLLSSYLDLLVFLDPVMLLWLLPGVCETLEKMGVIAF